METRERVEETEIGGDDASRETIKAGDEKRVLWNMKLAGKIL